MYSFTQSIKYCRFKMLIFMEKNEIDKKVYYIN